MKKIKQNDIKTTIEYAYKLYKGEDIEKDVKKAYELLVKMAKKGDNDARFWLGAICEHEEECLSPSEGFEWFLKAAQNGYAPAQFQIGYHYLHGVHVEMDYFQAYKWFMLSAIQGYPCSQNSLGIMYLRRQVKLEEWLTQISEGTDELYNGYDLEKNQRIGYRWLMKSARQKHPSGLYNLAGMYLHGVYVDKDEKLAISMYRIANEIGGTDTRALDMLKKLETDIIVQREDYERLDNLFMNIDETDISDEMPDDILKYILGTQKLSFPDMTENDELQIISAVEEEYNKKENC